MRIAGNLFALLVFAAAVSLSGCSEETEAPKKPEAEVKGTVPAEKDPRSVVFKSPVNPKVKPEDVIVVVNGAPITRAEYDRWVGLRTRVYCMAKKLDPTKSDRNVDFYNNATKDLALIDLVARELIRQRCEKEAIVLPEKVVKAGQLKFMKDINKAKVSFEDYLKTIPAVEAEEIRRQVVADVRSDYYLEQWATNDFKTVTGLEVSNRIEFVQNYQKTVDARNAESRRKAAEAKAEIIAGASFYSVTTNRAEIFKEDGKMWDVVELEDLEPDDDLFRFLATAKQGDISDPLDLEDGIGIVGVLLKEPGEAVDGKTPPDQYTLVRCMFNGYDEMDEPEDFEAMRKLLLERKQTETRKSLMEELFKDAKIEAPFGDKLFLKPHKGKGKGKNNAKGKKANNKKQKAKPAAA